MYSGTIICVNSVRRCNAFSLSFLYPVFSALMSEQKGKIKVVEIHAAKPWDAVEFFSVGVNNFL